MSQPNEPSLEKAKEYIYAMDFSNIINKMVVYQGWARKDAITVCEMYSNYLFLNKKYRNEYVLPPSKDIDEFWHNHILDTKRYQRDCSHIFGEYFNHYPYFGIDGRTDHSDAKHAFENTQRLYHREFGDYIYRIRSNWSKAASLFRMLVSGLFRKFVIFNTPNRSAI